MSLRKCRLINALIAIVLFLVLFADMFYIFNARESRQSNR